MSLYNYIANIQLINLYKPIQQRWPNCTS